MLSNPKQKEQKEIESRPTYQFYLTFFDFVNVCESEGLKPDLEFSKALKAFKTDFLPYEQERKEYSPHPNLITKKKLAEANVGKVQKEFDALVNQLSDEKERLTHSVQEVDKKIENMKAKYNSCSADEYTKYKNEYDQLKGRKKKLEEEIMVSQAAFFCFFRSKNKFTQELNDVSSRMNVLLQLMGNHDWEKCYVDCFQETKDSCLQALQGITHSPRRSAVLEKLREAQQSLSTIENQMEAIEQFYHAAISRQVMIGCICVYAKFIQLKKNTSFSMICERYMSRLQAFLQLLWCPELQDNTGTKLYVEFNGFDRGVKQSLFIDHGELLDLHLAGRWPINRGVLMDRLLNGDISINQLPNIEIPEIERPGYYVYPELGISFECFGEIDTSNASPFTGISDVCESGLFATSPVSCVSEISVSGAQKMRRDMKREQCIQYEGASPASSAVTSDAPSPAARTCNGMGGEARRSSNISDGVDDAIGPLLDFQRSRRPRHLRINTSSHTKRDSKSDSSESEVTPVKFINQCQNQSIPEEDHSPLGIGSPPVLSNAPSNNSGSDDSPPDRISDAMKVQIRSQLSHRLHVSFTKQQAVSQFSPLAHKDGRPFPLFFEATLPNVSLQSSSSIFSNTSRSVPASTGDDLRRRILRQSLGRKK